MQPTSWQARLPFFYGWVIIAVAFVTMAIAVTARTAFSLLLAPLISEFGWDRGLVAGAFSFGFLVSAILSPFIGKLMDARGPRVVIGIGVLLLGAGLLLAPMIRTPLHFYATLGLLVGGGANMMTYTAHSLFLPSWFVRRRALAISIAFSGVGAGAITLLPWLQNIIVHDGWRASCTAMGFLVLVIVGPITLLVRRRPEDLGLTPDGVTQAAGAARKASNIVDAHWAATDWTLARALRTARFWWLVIAYGAITFAWYAVQVHQTKYLTELGFDPLTAAWALGIVSVAAIPGQIFLGALSDRIGREWIWSISCAGFVVCYAALIALENSPTPALLYLMVFSQGLLGYAVTSVMGPIAAEIFEGKHYGSIFGSLTVALIGGGAVGPWLTGAIHDATGSYRIAFMLAIACCIVSAAAVWFAAPRKVRVVPGRVAAPAGRAP
ncbi:MAG TPA: MFS transporter [Burkholderiales bacterium]